MDRDQATNILSESDASLINLEDAARDCLTLSPSGKVDEAVS